MFSDLPYGWLAGESAEPKNPWPRRCRHFVAALTAELLIHLTFHLVLG